jgi:hypothetical protein
MPTAATKTRRTRKLAHDRMCDGCKAGLPHALHYSAEGTPLEGMAASCQVTWWRKPAILIECCHGVPNGDCTWSAWSSDSSLSDTQFARLAAEQGWTISPTRCPQHHEPPAPPLPIEIDPLLREALA